MTGRRAHEKKRSAGIAGAPFGAWPCEGPYPGPFIGPFGPTGWRMAARNCASCRGLSTVRICASNCWRVIGFGVWRERRN